MKRGSRTVVKVVGGALCIVAAAACLLVGAGLYLNRSPRGSLSDSATFQVAKGESVASIVTRLKAQDLIRSTMLLRLLSIAQGTEGTFKAGYYSISSAASSIDIHNLLVLGDSHLVKMTFPEGWTISKLSEHLERNQITPGKDFTEATRSSVLLERYSIPAETLEGYLFPDTYFFPKGFAPEAVAETMVTNFFKNLEKIVPNQAELNREELHRKVVLASIVEREYRVPEEAPQIASVFYNRLKWDIGLESCATLAYIITEIQEKPHPEYITLEDKKIDSAYNTYMWAGLPPGPISNPGIVALQATFHPAQTDYYYFLLKDKESGAHYFSKDLEEHNQAKFFYLKKVGSSN